MFSPPAALLLFVPGCAHCPVVLEALTVALKAGRLGRLEAVNIAEHPQVADAVGTRSVPWVRVGRFELAGLYTPGELAAWIEHAGRDSGWEQYLSLLLVQGRLTKALKLVRDDPKRLAEVIALAGTLDTPMAARIGAGAILEAFEGGDALRQHLAELVALTRSPQPQIRADGCHYLALTHASEVAEQVRPLLDDIDPHVREIAEDTLKELIGEHPS